MLRIALIAMSIEASVTAAFAGTFEDLGIPVTKAGLMGSIVGPDENGEMTRLYFNFNQDAAPLFLVQVDPATGRARQFNSPQGPGAWGFIVGPDKKIYLGTWDGGLILRFDPAAPDKGIEVVGKPSASERYIWMYTVGADNKLYGCTYPGAKIVSYDPATGRMEDLGRMDTTEQYARSIAADRRGWVYVGIGMARGSIVAFEIKTRKHRLAVPADHVVQGCGEVWDGDDGHAYGRLGSHVYRLLDGKAAEINEADAAAAPPQRLKDGRVLAGATLDGTYTLRDAKTGATEVKKFAYRGAGSRVFVVGEGPRGVIYGSTAMPLELFWYDPRSREMKNPGNPTSVRGEIYSFAHLDGKLYACAYPGGWLSIYDPTRPWDYGTKPENNPYGFGNIGDGHLRPRAMIVGADRRIYIGSLPPYGQLGGAMAVFDPKAVTVAENYRNLIPNQSIVALVWEPAAGLVFGGSSIEGGGGSHPTEKDAHLFAWDPIRKKKVVDLVPIAGRGAVLSLAEAHGRVFAILTGPTLVVYDVARKAIVHRADIAIGRPLEISLQRWKDGRIYGLTNRCIYTIDPKTYAVKELAAPGKPLHCGWAITDTGIYFGSGAHLMRYAW